MGVRERWVNLVHRAATGTKGARALLTPIGGAVFGAFAVLFVVAAIALDRLLHLPPFLPDSVRLPVSIPVTALGAAITAWSALHFLRAKGTPVPFNPPPRLVTTGPYRYVRNPMLTGVFVLLFGIGCWVNSISLAFVFTPLFVVANVWELKHIEEPELSRRLGDEYVEYRRQTPMFVPRSRPTRDSPDDQ